MMRDKSNTEDLKNGRIMTSLLTRPKTPRNKQTKKTLKVECLLTLAIWSYGHEAEEYIFLNLPFPSNPKGIFFQFAVF